jgi:protocatechuate 3,4-dioxygenase beta subunit
MDAARRTLYAIVVIAATLPLAARQQTPQRDVPASTLQERADAAAPRVGLAGRITSAADSSPLRRAVIAIRVSGRIFSRTFSDSDGRYEIEAPGGVSCEVLVTKGGYVSATVPRPRTERSGASTLDISLARGAVLSGRVMDPLGNPVVSVRVRLQQALAGAIGADVMTTTDDTGTFRIAGLSPGKYTIATAGRPEMLTSNDPMGSLVTLAPGRAQPPASSEPLTMDVASGEQREVSLLYREPTVILPYATVGGVVAGQIADEAGEPAVGLSVQLWQIEVTNGVPLAKPYGAVRTTDERGQYRLFQVRPGRYTLVVTDDALKETSTSAPWLPVYYPGTTSPTGAMAIDVARSQELTGVDLVFTHTRGARVFGVATNAAGVPLDSTLYLIAPRGDGVVAQPPRTVRVDGDGRFEFESLPPGDYVLRALLSEVTAAGQAAMAELAARARELGAPSPTVTPPREAEFGLQNVSVTEGDIGPIPFRTARPATLRGRIVFEDLTPVPTNFELNAFTTDPVFDTSAVGDGTTSRAIIDRQMWTFDLPRVTGPTRLRLSAVPPGVWLKSAYAGGIDMAESPMAFMSARDSRDDLVVVISGTAGSITGTVDVGAQVVAFSTNRERWTIGSAFVQSIYADTAGRFALTSLPPGEYFVAAIDSIRDELQRPEADRAQLLESLTSGARRVTVREKQTVTVSPRATTIE